MVKDRRLGEGKERAGRGSVVLATAAASDGKVFGPCVKSYVGTVGRRLSLASLEETSMGLKVSS